MEVFIVTIKLAKNPEHNPKQKKSNACPLKGGTICTDSTGEHHSFVTLGKSVQDVKTYWEDRYHVTRVESAIWR
jgi:hypothetical protein